MAFSPEYEREMYIGCYGNSKLYLGPDKAKKYCLCTINKLSERYSDQEIDSHCTENSFKILGRPKYVEPGMVAHNFIWVGEGKRPALLDISKPYNY